VVYGGRGALLPNCSVLARSLTEAQGAVVIAGVAQLSEQLHGLSAYLFVFTLLLLAIQAVILVSLLWVVHRG
jgi:hypothetical protein